MRLASDPARRSLALGALFALALSAFGQPAQDGAERGSAAASQPAARRPSGSPPDPNIPASSQRIRVQSFLVTTPVTALDASGDLVYGLDAKDFKVFDDGVPQQITRFEVASEPVAAVIVVQANDAVAPLLDQVRPLAPLFSDLLLGPTGQAAVLAFADDVRVLQNFSGDESRLAQSLRALQASGGKARLNDALARAIALLSQRPKSQRRLIVVFAEGSDQGSETTRDDVIRRAMAAEVTIYGLGFSRAEALLRQRRDDNQPMSPLDANVARPLPPGMPPSPVLSQQIYDTPVNGIPIGQAAGQIVRSAVAPSLLDAYAVYTGGVYYRHWSKNALEDQLTAIATEVRSQYELAYVPDTLDRAGFHRIEVEVRRPGVRARARIGYFYAPETPAGRTAGELPRLVKRPGRSPHLQP